MKFIARRFLTLLAAVVGALFGGCGGALLGMLYDPRAATYTVSTRGGGTYPGDRDD